MPDAGGFFPFELRRPGGMSGYVSSGYPLRPASPLRPLWTPTPLSPATAKTIPAGAAVPPMLPLAPGPAGPGAPVYTPSLAPSLVSPGAAASAFPASAMLPTDAAITMARKPMPLWVKAAIVGAALAFVYFGVLKKKRGR